jgi:transcriptional regulator with GAF, ATPase, and Fis domain
VDSGSLTGLTRIAAGPETGGVPSAACDHGTTAIDSDLASVYTSIATLARSMRDESDTRRFIECVSSHVRRVIPHDRLVLACLEDGGHTLSVFGQHAAGAPARHEGNHAIPSDPGRRYPRAEIGHASLFAGQPELMRDCQADPRSASQCAVVAGLRAWLALPLYGAEHVSGALIIGSATPDVYTEAHLEMGQRIAELIGPLVEAVALLHTERHRRRRLAVLPEVARVVGTSLNVSDIFDQLGDAVRPVLDFDVMLARLIGSSGAFEGRGFRMSDQPDEHLADRPEDYSFGSRLLAGEPALICDAHAELDPEFRGDRKLVERASSIMAVPLLFGERVGGVLCFAKRQAHWFDEGDVEVAAGIAVHVVVAIQHQRLAEEQRRLAAVEGRARQLEQRVARLRGALSEQYRFDRIIGETPAFREALDQAARVAPAETTVLLTGESGTGKELVARAIHHASRRAEGPFVAVNCAALPETLIESELFGHERGAFTGADKLKRGRFEMAAGGTLFLDEIGELSPAVQAKLLRVIQERQYERVGGTATLSADVRLLTATNQDLEQGVVQGRFRSDLYYRLAVFRVHLPALRERTDDVLSLADHFLSELAGRMGRGEAGLSAEARELLLAHRWPGNIRELQNAIERALILSDGGLISAAQLGIAAPATLAMSPSDPALVPSPPPALQPLAELEKEAILEALRRANGNKSRAAIALGLGRTQLYTRMRRFGLTS